jgi:hypothetical protein
MTPLSPLWSHKRARLLGRLPLPSPSRRHVIHPSALNRCRCWTPNPSLAELSAEQASVVLPLSLNLTPYRSTPLRSRPTTSVSKCPAGHTPRRHQNRASHPLTRFSSLTALNGSRSTIPYHWFFLLSGAFSIFLLVTSFLIFLGRVGLPRAEPSC